MVRIFILAWKTDYDNPKRLTPAKIGSIQSGGSEDNNNRTK